MSSRRNRRSSLLDILQTSSILQDNTTHSNIMSASSHPSCRSTLKDKQIAQWSQQDSSCHSSTGSESSHPHHSTIPQDTPPPPSTQRGSSCRSSRPSLPLLQTHRKTQLDTQRKPSSQRLGSSSRSGMRPGSCCHCNTSPRDKPTALWIPRGRSCRLHRPWPSSHRRCRKSLLDKALLSLNR